MFASRFRRFGAGLALSAVAVLAGCDKPEPLASTTGSISDLVTNVSVRGGTVPGVLAAGCRTDRNARSDGDGGRHHGGGERRLGGDGCDRLRHLYATPRQRGRHGRLLLGAAPDREHAGERRRLAVAQPSTAASCACAMRSRVPMASGRTSSRRCASSGPATATSRRAWRGPVPATLTCTSTTRMASTSSTATGTATTGGRLDIDSNAACTIDNTNNENIFWPLNAAPAGQYRVELHYYADCGVPRSDWVVTVLLKGQAPAVTTGSFVGLTGPRTRPS